jgi:hypothetical protein
VQRMGVRSAGAGGAGGGGGAGHAVHLRAGDAEEGVLWPRVVRPAARPLTPLWSVGLPGLRRDAECGAGPVCVRLAVIRNGPRFCGSDPGARGGRCLFAAPRLSRWVSSPLAAQACTRGLVRGERARPQLKTALREGSCEKPRPCSGVGGGWGAQNTPKSCATARWAIGCCLVHSQSPGRRPSKGWSLGFGAACRMLCRRRLAVARAAVRRGICSWPGQVSAVVSGCLSTENSARRRGLHWVWPGVARVQESSREVACSRVLVASSARSLMETPAKQVKELLIGAQSF